MKAVNLIPPDERRGDRAPLRTGAFTYVLVGGLALMVLLVAATALSAKRVSDRKDEKQSLEAELATDQARAASLAEFTSFRDIQQSREDTVTSLADSRFDWSRVLNELALILPSNIQVSSVTGTVNPQVELERGDQIEIRSTVPGPALEIIGCGANQDAVAGFVAALEDIDGVTRVGLDQSELGTADDEEAASTTPTDGSGDSEDSCPVDPTIAKFRIVVAFDAVPTPAAATAAPPSGSVPPATGAAPSTAQPTSNTPAGG